MKEVNITSLSNATPTKELVDKQGNEEVKSCSNCNYFHHIGGGIDQPYSEFSCMKGHWDGISSKEDYDELLKDARCVDFLSINTNVTEKFYQLDNKLENKEMKTEKTFEVTIDISTDDIPTDILFNETVRRINELKGYAVDNEKNNKLQNSLNEIHKALLIDEKFWKDYSTTPPPDGLQVLAQNDEWIDKDFCPDGIRVGFRNDDNFISSKWNPSHDCYDTIGWEEIALPIKWKLTN